MNAAMNAVKAKMSSIAGVDVSMKRYYEDKGNFYLVTWISCLWT